MKKTVVLVAFAALVLVPNALAAPAPNAGDRARANADCKSLRPSMNKAVAPGTFGRAFGTARAARADAFRNCVRAFSVEEQANRREAVAACRTSTAGSEDPNAFGECVAAAMRAESRAERRDAVNAAKTCQAERASLGAAVFNETYGTNANDRNAYGKCVSAHARAEDEETPTGA